MKGIELPINILVIVAIAVIVLLGLVALYFIGSDPFNKGISISSLKNVGCGNFTLAYDCGKRGQKTSDVQLPANSYGESTLYNLCKNKLGMTDVVSTTTIDEIEVQCRQMCGCL
jgi:hypothetical protein